MANRGITGNLLTGVQKDAVIYYELVYIDVNSGYRLTNSPYDLSYGGHTYRSFGQLIGFDSVEESATFEIPSMRITVSGIEAYDNSDNNFATTIIGADYIEKDVAIYRQYINPNGGVLGTFQIYEGTIQGATIIADSEQCFVDIETASHWADFDRQNGRFTNENSQQSVFSGDEGFEYAKDVQKEIEWKK